MDGGSGEGYGDGSPYAYGYGHGGGGTGSGDGEGSGTSGTDGEGSVCVQGSGYGYGWPGQRAEVDPTLQLFSPPSCPFPPAISPRHGMPSYTKELDMMFTGIAVDGSTAFVPGVTEIRSDDEDDESADEQETPSFQNPSLQTRSTSGSKRSSSTGTTASTPKKKHKNKTTAKIDATLEEIKVMNIRKLEFMEKNAEEKKQTKLMQAQLKAQAWEKKVEDVMSAARDCGADENNLHLWTNAVLPITLDDRRMTFFLKTEGKEARLAVLKNIANTNARGHLHPTQPTIGSYESSSDESSSDDEEMWEAFLDDDELQLLAGLREYAIHLD